MDEAECVDHIIPVRQLRGDQQPTEGVGYGGKDELFWAPWNHQPLCRWHHTMKTHQHDAWFSDNRSWLQREIALNWPLVSDELVPEIRNWILSERVVWPYGWFNLNPDPVKDMQILKPGLASQ